MKVDIKHREYTEKKLLGKKLVFPEVLLKVQLSEEELHIIKNTNISEDFVLERGTPVDKAPSDKDENFYNLTIADLVYNQEVNRSDKYCLKCPSEALEYVEMVKARLEEVKEYIDLNVKIEPTTISYEL